MKKNILLLFLFLSQLAVGQVINSVYPKVPYTTLYQVAAGGEYIYTSGSCDVNMVSTDGGETWNTLENTESALAIRILPGSEGNKALFLSRDKLQILDGNTLGKTTISNSTLSLGVGNFRNLEVDNENIYVIGNSRIYKSSSDETDWQAFATLTLESSDYINSTAITQNFLFIGTREGNVYKIALIDGTITELPGFGSRISAIVMVNDLIGYISAQSETYFSRTTDGWQTRTATEGMPENIAPVAFGENVVISVNTNRMYVSMDGGVSSTYTNYPEDGQVDLIYNTFTTADGTIYFIGRSGTILKTEDFAQSFENLNPYKRSTLNDICLLDNGLGYAVGENGTVIKTTDGGENWMETDLGFAGDLNLETLVCYEDGRLLIGHDNGISIFKDNNLVQTLPIPTYQILKGNDGNYLVASQSRNNGNVIARSEDRGDTWEIIANVSSIYYGSLTQSASGMIYASDGSGNIYVGANQGTEWDIKQFDRTNVTRFAFLNENMGIFAAQGKLYKTTDGGLSSVEIASGYGISDIYYFNENQLMYSTAQNQETTVWFSNNGGSTFSSIYGSCAGTRNSYFDGAQTVWLAQKGGHINKVELDLTTSTKERIKTDSRGIFPNPNTSQGTLRFYGLEAGSTEVYCYDMMGALKFSVKIDQNHPEIELPVMKPGNYILISINNTNKKHSKLTIMD